MFFQYDNLINEFALSSVRNSDKLYFDTLTNLQQSFVSMFYEKKAVRNKSLVSIIVIVIKLFLRPIRITNFSTWLIVVLKMNYILIKTTLIIT